MTMCDNKELLVGYVYNELGADERRTFNAHVQACAECRQELAGLQATRGHLATWAPPEPDLGFQVVRHVVEPRGKVVPFRSRWMPAFGLAAAAVLVLAAASAVANLEVRYDNDGLVVRTGWAPKESRTAQTAAPAQPQAVPLNASWRADFEALDRRLREIESAVTTPANGTVQVASGPRMTDAEIMRRMRDIVREAESRQDVAVAQRLLQVMQDFDRMRRSDFAMLQQSSAQYQGITNAELLKINERFRASQLEK
jgi:hypothetical protein